MMMSLVPQKKPFPAVFNQLSRWLPPAFGPHALLARGVNFLLTRTPWAMHRLSAYAGHRLSIEWGAQSFQFMLTEGGLLTPYYYGKDAVEVRLILPREDWLQLGAALFQQQPEQVVEKLRIEGDVGLARALAEVAGQLHWDIEGDIAQFTGDIVAVRLLRFSRAGVQWAQRAAQHIHDNIAEYLGHEGGGLTHHNYWEFWQVRQQALTRQLDHLEQRLTQLESDLP